MYVTLSSYCCLIPMANRDARHGAGRNNYLLDEGVKGPIKAWRSLIKT